MSRHLAISAAIAVLCASPVIAQDRTEQVRAGDAGDRLSNTINSALEADGPWLLPAERALIARKCGYAEGSDDNDNMNMNDGVLICSNGRRVDDPEVRAMAEVAGARISRRVEAVMESREVRNAIATVASQATQEALASLRHLRDLDVDIDDR